MDQKQPPAKTAVSRGRGAEARERRRSRGMGSS
jgi:hypothetical protein